MILTIDEFLSHIPSFVSVPPAWLTSYSKLHQFCTLPMPHTFFRSSAALRSDSLFAP